MAQRGFVRNSSAWSLYLLLINWFYNLYLYSDMLMIFVGIKSRWTTWNHGKYAQDCFSDTIYCTVNQFGAVFNQKCALLMNVINTEDELTCLYIVHSLKSHNLQHLCGLYLVQLFSRFGVFNNLFSVAVAT